MSSIPTKGSVIVADGNGRVTTVEPSADNEVFCLDSTDAKGAKFVKLNQILPTQSFKVTATGVNSTTATAYENIMELTIPGESIANITAIKILGKMTSGADSYSVRVYDSTNSNIIAEKTGLTNTSNSITDLGTLANLPDDEAIFEIQAKRIGGNTQKKIFIHEATISYNTV